MTWLYPSPLIIPHPNTVKFPHFPIHLPSSLLSLSYTSHSESRAVSLSSRRFAFSLWQIRTLAFPAQPIRPYDACSQLPPSCSIPVLLTFHLISFYYI
ncbi:hypothetical protein VNO80_02340 [Phaseolus coccineus]|uniref:Uncharacterized protein n=1 Tax=Phaseolus coccineus TaxID=3886 RepID=A0AAN9NPT4_PHACN